MGCGEDAPSFSCPELHQVGIISPAAFAGGVIGTAVCRYKTNDSPPLPEAGGDPPSLSGLGNGLCGRFCNARQFPSPRPPSVKSQEGSLRSHTLHTRIAGGLRKLLYCKLNRLPDFGPCNGLKHVWHRIQFGIIKIDKAPKHKIIIAVRIFFSVPVQ